MKFFYAILFTFTPCLLSVLVLAIHKPSDVQLVTTSLGPRLPVNEPLIESAPDAGNPFHPVTPVDYDSITDWLSARGWTVSQRSDAPGMIASNGRSGVIIVASGSDLRAEQSGKHTVARWRQFVLIGDYSLVQQILKELE